MNDPFKPGLLQRVSAPLRKVALVRASRLGDFICATPAFRALQVALPQAEITLIALPYVRELVARSPHLDRFEAFPGFPGIAEQFFDARRATDFFQRMQAERFDLAVQLHGSGVYANPFTLLLGAHMTAGFVRAGDPAGRLDAALPLPKRGREVQRVLALPHFLGAPDCGEETEYPLWPEDHATAEALLTGTVRPLIGLHPSARDVDKTQPPALFAAVGRELQRIHGGTVVVLGDQAAASSTTAVADMLGGPCLPCLNLVGKTPLGLLGAVIARLSVLVTNDSGPAHIAYALGTPSVTIFSQTDPEEWGPAPSGSHRVITANEIANTGDGKEQVVTAAAELLCYRA